MGRFHQSGFAWLAAGLLAAGAGRVSAEPAGYAFISRYVDAAAIAAGAWAAP